MKALFLRRAAIRSAVIAAAATAAAWAVPAGAAVPLVDAAFAGDAAAIRRLLDAGAPVAEAEPDGTTALHAAALAGDAEIAAILLEAGADPSSSTRYGITPLELAAANGGVDLIERLLDAGADPNGTSREGQTALMSAARNGSTAAIELLIARGADVNATEPFRGQTALMWAATRGNSAAVAALVAAGADIGARSAGGFTALLLAARENRTGTVEALLGLGADIEDTAPDGTSVLNVAIVNAYFDLAALLLDAGADPNAPDARGSALHTAVWLHKPGVTWDVIRGFSVPETSPWPTGRVTALELGRKLLERGADPNAIARFEETPFRQDLGQALNPPGLSLGRHYLSYDGATPFYVAARNGDYRFMRLLADFGADATIPTRFGVTPLMAAAGLDYYEGETPGPLTGVPEAERLEAVRLAVELGNDVDARTDFGDYRMEGSAEFTLYTYPHNFEELADLGVGDPRFDGMAAIHGAVISRQPSIVRYLIDAGADIAAANELGWTPLMMAEGFFLANEKKDSPAAARMLRAALAERGSDNRGAP